MEKSSPLSPPFTRKRQNIGKLIGYYLSGLNHKALGLMGWVDCGGTLRFMAPDFGSFIRPQSYRKASGILMA
jgi:hypothetical protein